MGGHGMFKIDIHTHILPPELPKGSGVTLRPTSCGKYADIVKDGGAIFRKVGENCYNPEVRLQDCDKSGVTVQVLSTVPVMFNYSAQSQLAEYISKSINDHMALVVSKHPTRFVGLGTLPMQDVDLSIKEMRRCREQLQLPGVEIGTHINDWNLSAPELRAFFEAAQDLDACLFVHPWDMMGQKSMPDYWLPWLVGMPAESARAICSMIFAGIFEKFPRLRVAFAHGGGSFPATIGRIAHGHKVRPDLCAVDCPSGPEHYLGSFWIDSLMHKGEMLDYVVDLVGANRVCLGSDYPFPLGEHSPGALIESRPYSDEVKQMLLADSALEWLNLSRNDIGAG